jgi:hypothetical protein
MNRAWRPIRDDICHGWMEPVRSPGKSYEFPVFFRIMLGGYRALR